MLSDILIVDSVPDVIRECGIEAYRGDILQEQGGDYFFVDIDPECDLVKLVEGKRELCRTCYTKRLLPEGDCIMEIEGIDCPMGFVRSPILKCNDCQDCIKPLPLKIAWFIIQAIRLQRQAYSLSIPPTDAGIREVFTKLEEG